LFGEGCAASVGGLLRISCWATRARLEDHNLIFIEQIQASLEFGKISILQQTLHGDDIYQKGCVWVILWNIFWCRMIHRERLCGDILGKQMKDHSIGAGKCIKLNLGRTKRCNRLLFEISILIVTSSRNICSCY
jgi:hypothetical protein